MGMRLLAVLGLVILMSLGAYAWTPDQSRVSLEAKYLQSRADLIDIDGVSLHVRESGAKTAPAIILLHGFGSSLQTWDGWVESLSQSYRVVRLDLPGSGLSSPDPTGNYTDERTRALILGLMDRLKIKRAVIIGNSIGGRLAWGLAARHPERVSRLVLIAPDGFASPGFNYGQKADVPLTLSLMVYVLPKALYRPNIEAAYGDPSRLDDVVLDRYYDLTLAPGSRKALLARMAQTVLEDPRQLLLTISQPVLLLWGDRDALIPPANAQDYLKALPKARLVTFPGLGHVPHEEDPAQSLVPVLAFLRG